MKKEFILNALVLLGIILYNLFFWSEKMGLNTLLFSGFIIGSLYYIYPEARQSRGATFTVAGTILSALMVVWHNSDISKVVHIFSMIIMVGMLQQPMFRFLGYGLILYLNNLFSVPKNIISNFIQVEYKSSDKPRFYWRYLGIPTLVVPVFFIIYYIANPQFAIWVDRFFVAFMNFWSFDISWERILFVLSSIFIVGAMLYVNHAAWLSLGARKQLDNLLRSKPERMQQNRIPIRLNPLGMKHFYRESLILLIILNALIFVANMSDLSYVWLMNQVRPASDMRAFVHEGTYLLIFGIVLAIIVILAIFRKNLNFYKNNRLIRVMAYVWIAQNAFMALSVAMRNIRYIDTYGLAYKRIGVFIFLILTLYGLYTMYVKVADIKTSYYLWRRNITALYALMLLCTCFNWDVLISRYNLTVTNKSNFIDSDFLLSVVSAKNLPVLQAYKQKLINNIYSEPRVDTAINAKAFDFQSDQAQYSWLSWNYSDYQLTEYIQKNIQFKREN